MKFHLSQACIVTYRPTCQRREPLSNFEQKKMNYTDIMNTLKTASLFDLFRLGIAISHEVENPDRIKAVRRHRQRSPLAS